MRIGPGQRPPTLLSPLWLWLGLLVMLLTAVGCASTQDLSCRHGEQPVVTESLYFGTKRPGGVVTPEEWNAFVNEVVTPAFPAGLTTWTASGQWRMASGVIERETSHVLQLTHDDAPQYDQAVHAIMARYKRDFQQEAVLRVRFQGLRLVLIKPASCERRMREPDPPLSRRLRTSKTVDRVIDHEPDRLHVGIEDRAAHEAKAALLQVLREGIAFR